MLADSMSTGRPLASGAKRRWSKGIIGYLPAGTRCLGRGSLFPAPLAKVEIAGEFRIATGATRYGHMRGRLAAASGALPGNRAARAGGIDQLRKPPTAHRQG